MEGKYDMDMKKVMKNIICIDNVRVTKLVSSYKSM